MKYTTESTTKEHTQALAIIKAEYSRLDAITGADTSTIALGISTRMSSRLGCFTVKKKNAFARPQLSITIAHRCLLDDALFFDVIRHEYAHAIVYLRDPNHRHVHDAVWKAACKEVGCIPKATRKDLPRLDPASKGPAERPYKYSIQCCKCGALSRYKTQGNVVKIALGKTPGTIICRKCGSKQFKVKTLQ